MTSSTQSRFLDDPIATVSGQFALCRPARDPDSTARGARPWGLRDLVPTEPAAAELPPMRYDHERQVMVLDDGTGRPLVTVVCGPPTAPTTQRTDGEDPPSSEDWKNDFAPDEPCPY
ncbi:MAG: putative ATP-grasp-modified RiPP [Pseudonocardia sp.]